MYVILITYLLLHCLYVLVSKMFFLKICIFLFSVHMHWHRKASSLMEWPNLSSVTCDDGWIRPDYVDIALQIEGIG